MVVTNKSPEFFFFFLGFICNCLLHNCEDLFHFCCSNSHFNTSRALLARSSLREILVCFYSLPVEKEPMAIPRGAGLIFCQRISFYSRTFSFNKISITEGVVSMLNLVSKPVSSQRELNQTKPSFYIRDRFHVPSAACLPTAGSVRFGHYQTA